MIFFNFGYDLLIILFVVITLTSFVLVCKLLCMCCRKSRSRRAYEELSNETSQQQHQHQFPAPPLVPSYAVVGSTGPYQNPGWADAPGGQSAFKAYQQPPPGVYVYGGGAGTSGDNLGFPAVPAEYYNPGFAQGGQQQQQLHANTNFGFNDGHPGYLDPPPAYSSFREYEQQRHQPDLQPLPAAPPLEEENK